jgi:predicted Zn-dependent protease
MKAMSLKSTLIVMALCAALLPACRTALCRPLFKDEGLEMINRGRFDDAVAWAEARLKVNPKDTDALNKAGIACLYKARKDPAALAVAHGYMTRSVRTDPLNALSHYNLGLVLLTMNRAREAVPEMRKTTLLAPEFAPGHAGLATAHFRTGDPLRGAAALRQAVALDPGYGKGFSMHGESAPRHLRRVRFLVMRQIFARMSHALLWAGPPEGVTAAHAARPAALFAAFAVCFAALCAANRGGRS